MRNRAEHLATPVASDLHKQEYELVMAADIGGRGERGYWIVVRDHRFGLDYEISSHCDYWDFIAALVDHKQYIGRVINHEAV